MNHHIRRSHNNHLHHQQSSGHHSHHSRPNRRTSNHNHNPSANNARQFYQHHHQGYPGQAHHHDASQYRQQQSSSNNNHRHTSTTTITTASNSTSTTDRSHMSANNGRASIFYSYLIAIISSFLVVLGIYLSLTRFNFQFLYISFIGFMIETIGACIYCVSRIHASKLARRKQRIDSDEFILTTGGNIDNNNHHAINNGTNLSRQQAQNPTTVTHILTNRALSNQTNEANGRQSNSIENSNNNNNTNNENISIENHSANPTAIQPETQSNSPPSMTNSLARDERQTSLVDELSTTEQLTNGGEVPTSSDSPAVVELNKQTTNSADNLQLPVNLVPEASEPDSVGELPKKNESCQESQATSIAIPNNLSSPESPSTSSANHAHVTIPVEQQQTINDNRLEKNPVDKVDIGTIVNDANDTNDLIISSRQIISGGLAISEPDLEPQVVRRLNVPSQQRPSNVRRTLVMGLGGEEEYIEIDEEDLDNMSILPPPYESIAISVPPQTKDT